VVPSADVRRFAGLRFAISLVALASLVVGCDEEQRALLAGQRPYHIPTTAMEPTIHKGEYVLTRDLDGSQQPVRSEIVVFEYPRDRKIMLAKRVVALPGETVECRMKQIFVNGQPLVEPYAVHYDEQTFAASALREPYRSRDNFGPLRLGPDEYFMMGDNRDSSNDSRYWGPVKRHFIKAHVVKVGPLTGPFRSVSSAG